MDNFVKSIVELLIRLPIVLLALTVHECAHGYVAYKLGDPTARNFGRLTLNPLKHIDPVGFICMILFRFGWAKPVPINTRYFKKPKRDMALSALAGPVSNLLMAFVGLLIYNIAIKILNGMAPPQTAFLFYLQELFVIFLRTFFLMNLSLAVFNLLPIPPLDGSRILFIVLPDKLYFNLMKYEHYISLIIMIALFTGFLNKPLSFIMDIILKGMQFIIGLIPFL